MTMTYLRANTGLNQRHFCLICTQPNVSLGHCSRFEHQCNRFNSHTKICNTMKPFNGRVAEVGKLSASAKKAFNSFVGRVFANSRQKTLFFRVFT